MEILNFQKWLPTPSSTPTPPRILVLRASRKIEHRTIITLSCTSPIEILTRSARKEPSTVLSSLYAFDKKQKSSSGCSGARKRLGWTARAGETLFAQAAVRVRLVPAEDGAMPYRLSKTEGSTAFSHASHSSCRCLSAAVLCHIRLNEGLGHNLGLRRHSQHTLSKRWSSAKIELLIGFVSSCNYQL